MCEKLLEKSKITCLIHFKGGKMKNIKDIKKYEKAYYIYIYMEKLNEIDCLKSNFN